MTHSNMSTSETLTQDKITIQEASRALNIGRKTIYRWLDKGLISRLSEDNKTNVLLSEVRALCDKGTDKDTKIESENVSDTKPDTNLVTLDREHYEGLLVKLGQMEAERRYLLEYKTGLEAKDKELDQARAVISKARSELQKMAELKQESERNKAELEKLMAEVERLKLPFWKRWIKR